MLVFIDTETGGLDPSRHSLLQIALMRYDEHKDEILDTFSCHITNPTICADLVALSINGIDPFKYYADSLVPGIARRKIIEFLAASETPARLAGHNVAFDYAFLTKLFNGSEFSLKTYVDYHLIDTITMIGVLKMLGQLPAEFPYSLKEITILGYDELDDAQPPKKEHFHDAVEDCRNTVLLFKWLLRRFKQHAKKGVSVSL